MTDASVFVPSDQTADTLGWKVHVASPAENNNDPQHHWVFRAELAVLVWRFKSYC